MVASATASYSVELNATHLAVSQPIHQYGGAYSFGGSAGIHPILLPSLHGGEGSSFPGILLSNDMVNSKSVVGIKLGNSGLVIMYHVDEFIHTCFVECLTA